MDASEKKGAYLKGRGGRSDANKFAGTCPNDTPSKKISKLSTRKRPYVTNCHQSFRVDNFVQNFLCRQKSLDLVLASSQLSAGFCHAVLLCRHLRAGNFENCPLANKNYRNAFYIVLLHKIYNLIHK